MTATVAGRNIDARLALHRDYWERKEMARPIAAFRITPDFFLSRNYRAAHPLFSPGKRITPDLLVVDDFLADYERMYQESETIGQDAFFAAEPYLSIPWLEAMLGCEIIAGKESFMSRHWLESLDQISGIAFDPNNPWVRKYLEFTEKLAKLSAGRFPVGMPIMRGPADVVGAIMGQAEMVLAMNDEPEIMQGFFLRIADAYTKLIKAQKALTPLFHGGEALGFYHLWTPGKATWYQEDLSTIMSPAMYRDFLRGAEKVICAGYDYTLIHLHPASFFILDELLQNDWLKAVQVNKDVGGPSVAEMLPQFQKITAGKNLALWGDLDLEDLKVLRDGLPCVGLFFFITVPDYAAAGRIMDFLRNWR